MHFLRKNEVREWNAYELVSRFRKTWGFGWACITAKLVAKAKLQVQADSLSILKGDTKLALLPERIAVVDCYGKVIRPSKGSRFYVSTETFDPFHIITEIEETS